MRLILAALLVTLLTMHYHERQRMSISQLQLTALNFHNLHGPMVDLDLTYNTVCRIHFQRLPVPTTHHRLPL